MATLKEKQALLKQVEDQIKTLQDEYDKGVNEKESLGKRLLTHFGEQRPDFQKEEEFSDSDHSIFKSPYFIFNYVYTCVWKTHKYRCPKPELQSVVSHLTCVLGTTLQSFSEAVSTRTG